MGKQWQFYFYFPIWIAFIFSFLIAMSRTSKTMLNNSGESEHPCLIPYLRGSAFSFSPLIMMFAVGLSYVAFIMFPLCPLPGEISSQMGVEFCQKFCLNLLRWSHSYYFSICWCSVSHWFICRYWKNTCITGINLTWSWYVFLLISCIWFASIFWGFPHLFSSLVLAYDFLFCDIIVWF